MVIASIGFSTDAVLRPAVRGLVYARADMGGGAYRWDNIAARWIPLPVWISARPRTRSAAARRPTVPQPPRSTTSPPCEAALPCDDKQGDPLDQGVGQVECGRMGNQRNSCANAAKLERKLPTSSG
ncbi:hypothetical protein M2283_009947, partial [Streptomyces pseudovenezuelae]|nr:hypothetical protein [Streptomyces pseudovenezuelae]